MNQTDDSTLLRDLLTGRRVLALGVLVEGAPYVGQLPFVARPDFRSLLIHASSLARHSKGLAEGAPFSALIQSPDTPESDPLQLPRLTVDGQVHILQRTSPKYPLGKALYLRRFPGSEVTFGLGDFRLCELKITGGRFVAGFARVRSVTPEMLAGLAQS